jgi:L-ascorbate metabolism protein UlaG (beta-lactamase superfamily)
MMPEQTAQAHMDLNGKVLMPIHWGAFTLAMHSWTEPVERLSKKAAELNIKLATPQIGEPLVLNKSVPNKHWWQLQ